MVNLNNNQISSFSRNRKQIHLHIVNLIPIIGGLTHTEIRSWYTSLHSQERWLTWTVATPAARLHPLKTMVNSIIYHKLTYPPTTS
jgi:hypothetical protein